MGMSNQTEEKELFHAVSLSGGKDSTAMLLLMIERGLPIQAVLTADTGMEFPEMYEHLQKLNDYLFAERGLHLTWLRHPKGFEWLMFEEKKQRPASIENRQRLGVSLYGNGWPGPRVRWCTGQLKTHLIHKEINRLKGQYRAVSYVGIAADEPKRIKSERYPLVDWGITEKEALQICYDRGYDFVGCIRFTTAAPAGAARCRALGSCESSGSITRSYGSGCGKWTNVRWHSSVPARWGNSRRIGAWNDWSSDLRQKRSNFLFHPCRRSVSDDVSRTE